MRPMKTVSEKICCVIFSNVHLRTRYPLVMGHYREETLQKKG